MNVEALPTALPAAPGMEYCDRKLGGPIAPQSIHPANGCGNTAGSIFEVSVKFSSETVGRPIQGPNGRW